ncbi:hypothetical protein KAH94_00900, partial [bacterium]|nr:hypothetical protein [bacterium]
KIRKIKNLSIGISKLKKEIPNAAHKIVASYQTYKRAYFMSKPVLGEFFYSLFPPFYFQNMKNK